MRESNRVPILLALRTDGFPHRTTAQASLDFLLRSRSDLDEASRGRLHDLYSNCRIETRHLAIPDFSGVGTQRFFEGDFGIPVEQRLDRAHRLALPIVCRLAKEALHEAKVPPEQVGQIVVVTSTVLSSPGMECVLTDELGISRDVSRVCVNYMGCAAGVTGLRLACDYVKALDAERRHLVSLIVCVEASSLHATMNVKQNDTITHSLFADGVACAIVGGRALTDPDAAGKLAICDFQSMLIGDCGDGIRLQIQSDGVACLLSRRLPAVIEHGVADWLEALLDRTDTSQSDLSFWAIHPGGRKIIERAVKGLRIDDRSARFSWDVLREYGNVLSCGIFFVLRQMLDTNAIVPGDHGVAFSFAPGVSVEGVLLQSVMPRHCTSSRRRPSRTRLRVKTIDGTVVPEWTPDNLIRRLGEYDERDDDIIVVTYPKAGTTWVLQILHLLQNGGEQGGVPLDRAVGWLERDDVGCLRAMPGPRLIKTHLPLRLLPFGKAKYVYVGRNPKDLAVSYFHHARAKEDFGYVGSWDDFLKLFLDGQVEGGDWWEHTLEGLVSARAAASQFIFLWYEEMRGDPHAAIRRIADFAGIEASDELVTTVVDRSTLQYMRGSRLTNVKWTKERRGEAPHLRCGAVGEWDVFFSECQEQLLEAKWASVAAAEGIVIPKRPDDIVGLGVGPQTIRSRLLADSKTSA